MKLSLEVFLRERERWKDETTEHIQEMTGEGEASVLYLGIKPNP